jgi:hypothetical protein
METTEQVKKETVRAGDKVWIKRNDKFIAVEIVNILTSKKKKPRATVRTEKGVLLNVFEEQIALPV